MSANSKIAWTDATWNPVRGCAKISAGCANCYAERFAERWRGIKGHPFEHGFDVRLVPGALDLPLRWRKPRKVFVNSMSDLFHEQVPDEYIHRVFAKMALADRHTFQVLTKRPERMRRFFEGWMRPPLPNVWLGVTAEDQRAANERIPLLLQTPAAVRFVSVEPMLGPVDLSKWLEVWGVSDPSGKTECSGLDWIIVGGESGPKARPFHIEWARSLLAQCREAGVPTFVKQAGAFACLADKRLRLKEPAGRDPSEWPDDMRVQEFPGGGR